MDGRDIGTVVLPNAELKVYMIVLLRNALNVVKKKMNYVASNQTWKN